MLKIKEITSKKTFLILIAIILIGFVMRVYNFEKSFNFGHDHDLYSWIAKDIVVNKHIRSVGQITSVDGVFIGPLYYYIMAASYWLSNMDPMSAIVPTTIIGLLTILSFYFFGKKYFSERVGLIMAFIHAVSFGTAFYDKWSVPTEPAIIWSVWFLYVIFGMFRKNLKLMPLYAVLVGLTYHIHIALLPILPIPILAYFMSKGTFKEKIKAIKIKNVLISFLIFMMVSSPFWFFEIKHNFSQVKSVIIASKKDLGNPTGFAKLKKVINASSWEMQRRLISEWPIKPFELMWIVFIFITYVVYKFKKISKKDLNLLLLWMFLIGLAQFTSKRVVSEYYFTNYLPIYILMLALFFDLVLNKKYLNKIALVIGGVYLVTNFYWLITANDLNDSYFYKKQLVEYIRADQIKNNYPCVGINYIAKFGDGVGFRYLFWYKGVDIIKPSNSVPTYNVVVPWDISNNEVNKKFGRFGVILPVQTKASSEEWCKDPNNKIDPLLGYTE
jgi:4-amino-4-deoxy-L-arabinose transferase-like glycosyltransferase